ncbi:MAG TPA: glycosyltransferase [Thermoanaerobaculia bacterium]|nr:glycosyltransferase [Thermoanaerobaculia bacterium]
MGVDVDVIVPVFGAAEDLERCLASVAVTTDLMRHRLMLVIDGPQEPRVEEIVRAFPNAQVLRNEQRLGFVRSVNRGMRESTRDVVLLNSDTIVTPRWLEKMIDAATSNEKVGTVTPFSNNATLCSVPQPFEENLLPSGYDVNAFAALIERVSAREYPRIPTGVGFCMFIRRALLDEIGLFDEEHFGHGYGEENDFCVRASQRGWQHLLDDATFVYHAGKRSFRAEAQEHQRRGAAALQRLHPDYLTTIARFVKSDPVTPTRKRIHEALRNRPGLSLKVAHLVHGWPPFARGGSELYAQWLVQEQLHDREVSVYARLADLERGKGEAVELRDDGARVRLVTNNFLQRDPFSRNALRDRDLERDFAKFLREERPSLLHVHHLAGHAFSLVRVARKLGIPIVHSLHDWWSLCARVNLFDKDGRRCSGPALTKCARCATLTRVPPATMTNLGMHGFRRAAARAALAHADVFVMPSQAIRDDFAREGILPRGRPVHVIPYGIDLEPRTEPKPHARWPLRFGIVGVVLPHKGLHLAAEVFRDIDPSHATLHIWGNTNADPDYTRTLPPSSLEGTFNEVEKDRVFDSIDVLLMPSIGLESFGLVAREAMARGVPVIAANDGALRELFPDGRGGAHFHSGDVESLRDVVLSIIDNPSRIDAWSRDMPRPKSAAAHAAEIDAVYASLEKRRR